MQQDDKKTIALNVKNFDFGVPQSTYTDISLPTEGNSGVKITWSSSDPEVLADNGTLVSAVAEDVRVTLTARISKGDYYYDLPFEVTVKAGDGTFDGRTLIASYFEDEPQDLSVTMDGSLSVANPYSDAVSRGIDISGGVTIEFDVEKTGDIHTLGTILSFMGSGRLYFTPGSYLGYNATGGYFDANVKDYGLVEDYIGDAAHVSLQFTKDGFAVYVNDELAYDQSILSTENGGASLTDYSKVLTWLNQSADTLYFGYGSWWSAAGYDEANCKISNVKCYVEKTPGEAEKAATNEPNSTVWYEEDSLVLESTDAISYVENPFYGVDTNCLYLAYTINFSDEAAKNGWDGVLSFYNSATGGRISVQTNPYVCFNDGAGSWLDINNPGNSANGGTNWAATAETGTDYRVEILIKKTGATVTVDGETIACSIASSGTAVSYDTLLEYLSTCDQLTWGVGQGTTSYWWTEMCTLSDIVIAGSPDLVKMEEEEISLTSTDQLDARENPFQGKDMLELDITYTINFDENAAKNGYDGIFSFYPSTGTGRVSMQTNPYICYNDMAGTWIDLNQPGNTSNGGTDWAASAETGKDYLVSIQITGEGVHISVDGEEISTSLAGTVTENYGQAILDYIKSCDSFSFGVGLGQVSFWNTELCTISNFTAKAISKTVTDLTGDAETDNTDTDDTETEDPADAVEQIGDNSWKISKNNAILYLDNPVKGEELSKLQISYDVEFDSNAAKNGWDGLFSFYDPSTNARVSVQSAPYICYNEMAASDNKWLDLNNPSLDGSTDWAASAVAGQTYHVDITITADTVTLSVDDEELAYAENSSGNFEGYQSLLDQIAACENLTIGVGEAVASFWNTELCTLSNLTITANGSDADNTDTDESESGDNSGSDGSTDESESGDNSGSDGSTDESGSGDNSGNTGSAGNIKNPMDKNHAGNKPVDKNHAGNRPADKNPLDKNPAGNKPAGKNPAGKNPADKTPAGNKAPQQQAPSKVTLNQKQQGIPGNGMQAASGSKSNKPNCR
jgi:hypothetical protein